MYRIIIDYAGLYAIIPEETGVIYPFTPRRTFDHLDDMFKWKIAHLNLRGIGHKDEVGEKLSEHEYLIY